MRSWQGSKTVLGSTYVVEQLLFSVLPSIIAFVLYLILGSFLGPKWATLGVEARFKNYLGSTNLKGW